MSRIHVDTGDGMIAVDIAGDTPTPQEAEAIRNFLHQRAQPQQQQPQVAEAAPPIPEPIFKKDPTAPKPDTNLDRFLRENFKTAAIMTGASTGAQLGAAGGPAGMIAGGILGAAAGASAEGLRRKLTLEENARFAASEAYSEFLWSGGTMAGGAALRFMGPGIGRALGIKEGGRTAAEVAERKAIPIGVIDASEFQAVKGFRKVLGKFPWVARPFNVGSAEAIKATERNINQTLDLVAPHTSMWQVGEDIVNASRKLNTRQKRTIGNLYKVADDIAARLTKKDIVPSDGIRQEALEWLGQRQRPLTTKGVPTRPPPGGEIRNFAEEMADLAEGNMSVENLRALQQDLSQVNIAADDHVGRKGAAMLRSAFERALNNLDLTGVDAEQAKDVAEAYSTANRYLTAVIKHSKKGTARTVSRAEPGIFRSSPARAMNLEADEVAKALMRRRSPQALDDLRATVGEPVFRKAVRQHLEQAFAEGLSTRDSQGLLNMLPDQRLTRFDPGAVRRALDLGTDTGKESLEAMLRGSGLSPKKFEELLSLMDRVGELEVPSQFLARRATIGGIGSLLRAATGTAAAGGAAGGAPGAAAGIVFTLAMRNVGNFLTSPTRLKVLSQVAELSLESGPALQSQAARTMLARALRIATENEEE